MDCSGVTGLINRYIDGELGYVETAGLQQHLDFCPDCSAELRELSGLRGALAAWGRTQLVPPPGLAEGTQGVGCLVWPALRSPGLLTGKAKVPRVSVSSCMRVCMQRHRHSRFTGRVCRRTTADA